MQTWYVLEQGPEGNVTKGPFGLAEMAAMAAAGRLTRTTYVARSNAPHWAIAAEDPELAPHVGASGAVGAGGAFGASSAFGASGASGAVGAGGAFGAGGALGAGGTPAPPIHPYVQRPSGPPAPPPPYSIGAAFTLGWKTFTQHWAKLVLVGLCLLGISILLGLPVQGGFLALMGLAHKTSHHEALLAGGLGLGCFGFALAILVGIPLGTGFMYAGVRAARGEMAVTDIFAGFRRYGAVIGTGVLSKLIGAGVALVCLAPFLIGLAVTSGEDEPLYAVVGGIISMPVLLAVLCFLSVFLTVPTVLVIDPRVHARGGVPALSLAWQMGKGNSPSFFLLMLCGVVIAEVSAVCGLFVGYIIFGLPLLLALFGVAYELMVTPIVALGPDPRKLA